MPKAELELLLIRVDDLITSLVKDLIGLGGARADEAAEQQSIFDLHVRGHSKDQQQVHTSFLRYCQSLQNFEPAVKQHWPLVVPFLSIPHAPALSTRIHCFPRKVWPGAIRLF